MRCVPILTDQECFKARLNEVMETEFARCKEESSSSKGRHAKMHVGHSLTSCSKGSPEDHEKNSIIIYKNVHTY